MKYIIFDDIFPVIFNEAIAHKDIKVYGMQPTSAGFVTILPYCDDNDRVHMTVSCKGESISLKLKSNEEKDADIINNTILNY